MTPVISPRLTFTPKNIEKDLSPVTWPCNGRSRVIHARYLLPTTCLVLNNRKYIQRQEINPHPLSSEHILHSAYHTFILLLCFQRFLVLCFIDLSWCIAYRIPNQAKETIISHSLASIFRSTVSDYFCCISFIT